MCHLQALVSGKSIKCRRGGGGEEGEEEEEKVVEVVVVVVVGNLHRASLGGRLSALLQVNRSIMDNIFVISISISSSSVSTSATCLEGNPMKLTVFCTKVD